MTLNLIRSGSKEVRCLALIAAKIKTQFVKQPKESLILSFHLQTSLENIRLFYLYTLNTTLWRMNGFCTYKNVTLLPAINIQTLVFCMSFSKTSCPISSQKHSVCSLYMPTHFLSAIQPIQMDP